MLVLVVAVLAFYTARCRLEENIFKLLPDTGDESFRVTFTNLKLKDKIFVQAVPVVPTDTTGYVAPDADRLAEAMDMFMDSLCYRDSVLEANGRRRAILHTLSEINPQVVGNVAMYAMEHMPAYLETDSATLDSLCSPEHIAMQVEQYYENVLGQYDDAIDELVGYDPCGIAIGTYSAILPEGTLDGFGESRMLERFAEENYHIYAPEEKACLAFITPNFGTDDSREASRMVKMMKEVRDQVRAQYPDVDILFHGSIVIAGGNSKQMRRDIYITVGIAMLIICILLAVCLKRPTYLMLTVLALIFGVIVAMAGLCLIQGGVSLMSLGIGCIVLGVAFSYVLHVLIHYIYTGSISQTLDEQTKPVIVGSLTTIGAFAGLLLTQSPLLKDFGLFALLVIAGTTLFSLIAAPQFLPRKFAPNRHAFAVLEKMNSYHIDRNKPIVIITILWVAVCICFSGKYQFDNDLRHIGYTHPDCKAAQNHWNELMNEGYNQQYYASVAPSLEQALEQLPVIEKSVDSLRQAGMVKEGLNRSMLMPDTLTQLRRMEAWHAYFTEEKQEEVWNSIETACEDLGFDAEEVFYPFRELMASEDLRPELIAQAGILPPEILENFVETKDSLTLVYFSIKNTPENTLAVNDCLTAVDGAMLMNPYYYCKNLIELIKNDFNLIMWISSAFVLLLLLITYRNIWLTLIALLPMVLSWYTVLGAMALFGHSFNLINIIASAFIFGIGVDYSVFIMEGLLKGDDNNPTMVYNKTAITLSAVILMICMFVLGFAVHPAVQSISFASLVGMITTIMLSYTIEPILYRFYVKCKNRKSKISNK